MSFSPWLELHVIVCSKVAETDRLSCYVFWHIVCFAGPFYEDPDWNRWRTGRCVCLSGCTVRRGLRVKGAEDKALWHHRLGHPSFGVLSCLPFVSCVSNHSDKFGGCDICFKSKQTRGVFSKSYNKASVPFELIHVDLWGPYREPASCGAVYFLTIVDDCSRAVWIHLLLEKSN